MRHANHTQNKKSIARRFSGIEGCQPSRPAIEATSFFWFVFSATGKNEQYQAKENTTNQ